MTKQQDAVGVIGLGIMGGAFARNLAAAGWRVIGYDIDEGRCRAMTRRGVWIAEDAKDVARNTAVIVTSLPSPGALMETVRAIAAVRARKVVVVEAGTFAIKDKIAAEAVLARGGHQMLDCPVSGTGAQAQRKDIIIYASGASQQIRRLRPLFESFSRGVYDLGEFGNGSKMKYVANLLVAINNVAAAEAMVFGMKAGLDPQLIHDMVVGGAANSRVFELRAPMMVAGRYDDATMKVSTWQKDMQVIGDFIKKLRTPTPLFAATRAIYAAAMTSGHAAHDTAAVCAVLEKQAGLRRGKAKEK
jgi:3-hydroxyisobutyrate dehydrogenase-like beta-hydroxyacid dehydrogenase